MDIAAAKTFLAIVEAGNFISASRRLHVTQSTVSARIRGLEEMIGTPLFIRTKAACEMTPAGQRFYRHARTIVRAWEEARHQIAVPLGFTEHLAVGGQYSLWNHFLLDWLESFRTQNKNCSLKASVGMPDRLMRQLVDGVLDLGVMYAPQYRPGLVVEELFKDELIMVSAGENAEPDPSTYVFIDWGEEFRHWHGAHFEELHNPGLALDLGSIGISYLIATKKAGYFPKRIAEPYLKEGSLRRLSAPVFEYPVYTVYQSEFRTPEMLRSALRELIRIGESIVNQS